MQGMAADFGKIAVFWDKSFLWGLIAYRTFRDLGLDFDLLEAADIRAGRLAGHDLVFVPGGWASDKMRELGEEGAGAVRSFVAAGGGYLGFCGGAGLALSHDSGLGLARFGRLATRARVPSFSGLISLKQEAGGHPVWAGVADGAEFHAWWPGQFAVSDDADARVLATYGRPGAGAFVTDLPVDSRVDWDMWEEYYGINLDPERLLGEPAVMETTYGQGRVILSYLHFETPGDETGRKALLNSLAYLVGKEAPAGISGGLSVPGPAAPAPAQASISPQVRADSPAPPQAISTQPRPEADAAGIARELTLAAAGLIDFGRRNFLWWDRNSWLLQWRRGVRGIEYSTIMAMFSEISTRTERLPEEPAAELTAKLARLRLLALPFLEEAAGLLLLERYAMGRGPLSPLKTRDPRIQELRERLFSTSKRCGGKYEEGVFRGQEKKPRRLPESAG